MEEDMPLRLDGNYRGPRALHVRDHRKLGKHRTLITPSLGIVNWLIAQEEVTTVSFGKIVGAFDAKFTPRVEIKPQKGGMKVLLVAKNCAQTFDITVRTPTAIDTLTKEIIREWPLYQAANDY
jgi:hypothetical protein